MSRQPRLRLTLNFCFTAGAATAASQYDEGVSFITTSNLRDPWDIRRASASSLRPPAGGYHLPCSTEQVANPAQDTTHDSKYSTATEGGDSKYSTATEYGDSKYSTATKYGDSQVQQHDAR